MQLFWQAAFQPGGDGYFIPFLSLSALLGDQSFSFHQLHQEKCSLTQGNFLQLQCNLWNAFMDRFRSAHDDMVDAGLEVLRPFMDVLWLPLMTRTGHGMSKRVIKPL